MVKLELGNIDKYTLGLLEPTEQSLHFTTTSCDVDHVHPLLTTVLW